MVAKQIHAPFDSVSSETGSNSLTAAELGSLQHLSVDCISNSLVTRLRFVWLCYECSRGLHQGCNGLLFFLASVGVFHGGFDFIIQVMFNTFSVRVQSSPLAFFCNTSICGHLR